MFYYIKLDVPKKRIPRAEFHGIFLDLVDFRIFHKVESVFFCPKRRISILKKIKFSWSQVEIPHFRQKYGLSTLWAILHSTKIQKYSMEFRQWNPLFRHIQFYVIKHFLIYCDFASKRKFFKRTLPCSVLRTWVIRAMYWDTYFDSLSRVCITNLVL